MKFKLVEEFDNEFYRDLEEFLIDEFYKLSEVELLRYGCDETGGGAIWILPNGNTIELDIHQDFGEEAFYKFCKEYFEQHPEHNGDYDEDDFALEDAHDFNDHLVYNLGWLKFNSGTFYDDRYYAVLPRKRMTSNQFRVLENILEETSDETMALLVIPQLINPVTYYFSKHTPQSIIKSLQRFYTSGVLEESNHKIPFKLVEDINLEEEVLNEYRGQGELREFICEELNRTCGSTLNHSKYQVHHKDFYHNNTHPDNIVLVPTKALSSIYKISPNASIHGKIKPSVKGFQALSSFSNKDIADYINIITNYDCIDYSRSMASRSIHILTKVDLARDIARARKHPLGMIK